MSATIIVYKPVHANHDHGLYAGAFVESLRRQGHQYVEVEEPIRLIRAAFATPSGVIVYCVPNKWSVLLLVIIGISNRAQVVFLHDQKPHPGSMWLFTWVYNLVVRVFARVVIFNEPTSFFRKKCLSRIKLGGLVRDEEIRRLEDSAGGDRVRRAIFFGRWMGYRGISRLPGIIKLLDEHQWGVLILSAGSGEMRTVPCDNLEVRDKRYSREELGRELQQVRVGLFPYISATQSGAIIEALSHGVVCVVQDIPELRLQLDGISGVIFIDFDKESELIEAIGQIQANEVSVDYGQIRREYSYSALVERFDVLCSRLLSA